MEIITRDGQNTGNNYKRWAKYWRYLQEMGKILEIIIRDGQNTGDSKWAK